MPAPFRERVFRVTVKPETVSGTDSVPTLAANAIQVVGVPQYTIEDLEPGDREDVISGVLGVPDRAPSAGATVKVDLQLEVKGAGTAYSASNRPPMDPLLRGCGFSSTVDASVGVEKVTYVTLDDGMETFSMYLYSADSVAKVVGCVATAKLEAEVPRRAFITFSVTGKLAALVFDAMGAPTLNTLRPGLFHSQAISIGAFTSASNPPLVAKKVGFDLNNTIVDRASAGATDGLIGFLITDRKAQQTMQIERVPLANFDPDAIAAAGGSGTNTKCVYQIGATQYIRLKVNTGTWAFKRPARSSANGLLAWDLSGGLVHDETVSGRELRLVFD